MGYLRIIRWPNLLIMAMVMGCLRFFLVLPQFHNAGIIEGSSIMLFILLVAGVISIAAGGYVINDVFDIEIDAVNHRDSQIVGNEISIEAARKYYLILSSIGILIGFFLAFLVSNFNFGLIFPVMAALLYYYSKRYKRQVISGNIVVAFASAMVLVVAWNFEILMLNADNEQLANGHGLIPFISRFVYAYTFFAFFSTLIREIVKDVEDIEGDSVSGCLTLPVLAGVSASKKILSVLVLLLMTLVAYWQYWLWVKGYIYGSGFLFLTQFVGIVTLVKLFSRNRPINWHLMSNLMKVLMISGIASIVLLNF